MKKIIFVIIFSFCALAFSARGSKDIRPYYLIYSKDFAEDAEKNITFTFYNASNKTVCSYTVSLLLLDENNMPIAEKESYISFVYELSVLPRKSSSVVIALNSNKNNFSHLDNFDSLDNFDASDNFSEFDESSYTLESLYVSKIEYEDGSTWNDPYGLYAPF
ncbi:MAG: hypothetical protein IJR49_02090 [Treponema sp.]|nr:hypothetical protein [Treponema sp.]